MLPSWTRRHRRSCRNTGRGKLISASSWRSCGRRGPQWIKKDALGVDFRAARFEVLLQFRRVERIVVFAIELQANLATGVELMCGQIVEEEFPLRYLPELVALVAVEANHVGGDDIEFRTEIGQGLERFDPPDFALHAQ